MTKEELQAAVTVARKTLADAEDALLAFDALPENNVFASLYDAEGALEDRLRNEAFKDCEGAGNCGDDEYTQEFIVDGVRYVGTLSVEYNRHDKTYYYIDSAEFTYAPVDQPAA
jgi:hypothetical protein